VISETQIKAARLLLGWSQSDLALNAGVSQIAVARIETIGKPSGKHRMAIRRALEEAGVAFVRGDPGVEILLGDRETLLALEAEDENEESD
jgi:transcriptional regulator with XRE-family HTH domain